MIFFLVIAGLLLITGLLIVNTATTPSGALTGAALLGLGVILLLVCLVGNALARDLGQWESTTPEIREWYKSLMQPDVPTLSCCSEADAYWCDDIHVRGEKTFCKITDDRPDEPRGRPHREMGTEFEIPPNKLKFDRGNPTGHSVIFLSRNDFVFCFVQGGGA